jgi:hypothetical protein
MLLVRVENFIPKGAENDDDLGIGGQRRKRSKWIRYNPLTKLWKALAVLFKKRKDKSIFLLLIICHVCYAAPGSGIQT